MVHFVFKVGEVFPIKGRGIILCPSEPNASYEGPNVSRGALIELRRPDLPPIRTEVSGIVLLKDQFHILICTPDGFVKTDVPVGTKIWLIDEDADE
jgi:hypothetical protein